MFVRPNHQFTQPCTSQTNGCQTHSVSAAKSQRVWDSHSRVRSHALPPHVFFVTLLFLLAFSDVNRPRCFPSAAVFPSLGRQRGGKSARVTKHGAKTKPCMNFVYSQVSIPIHIYAFLSLQTAIVCLLLYVKSHYIHQPARCSVHICREI